MTIPVWNRQRTIEEDRTRMSDAVTTEYYIDMRREVTREIVFSQETNINVTLWDLIEQDYLSPSAYITEEDGMGGYHIEITDDDALDDAIQRYGADVDDDIFEYADEEETNISNRVSTSEPEAWSWGLA